MARKTMIKNLIKARKAYEDQLASLKNDASKNVAQALAEFIPEGCSVKWNQYTPYFNDGNPCTFRADDPTIGLIDSDYDCDDYTRVDFWDVEGYEETVPGLTKIALGALNDLWKEIPYDMLLQAFGDHVKITVLHDGTWSVDDYDHD